MKDESDVFMLFHRLWAQYLRMRFPEAGSLEMDDWLQNTSIEVREGELLCIYNAPIEWADFKQYYDEQVELIYKALTTGLEFRGSKGVKDAKEV